MKPTANLPLRSYRSLPLIALLLSIACGTTFAQANSGAPDPIEGKWYGVTGFPTDRVELGFEFKRNERQELKAYLYAPVVNFYGLELPGLVKRDGQSYVNDAYRLSVTLTDGVLAGTYFPLNAPILLKRTNKLPVEVPLPELPKGPGPKWQVKLGSGIYAPVAVRDGNVYVGTSGGLFQIDGVIYVGSGAGSMHAVNATTGERVWRFAGKGKIRTDAVGDGPRVLFGTFDNILYAIDRQTGNKVWEKDTRGPITNSPAMIGGRLIVGNRNGLLAALNPVTGEVFWRMLFWGSAIESSAVASEAGLFYIGASDLRRVSLIDAKDGRVVWRTDVYGWPWARPALSEKVVYVSVAGGSPYQMRHVGSLTALARKSGKILWRWPMQEWPGSFLNGFSAAPVVAEGTVVVGGLDGTLYGFAVE